MLCCGHNRVLLINFLNDLCHSVDYIISSVFHISSVSFILFHCCLVVQINQYHQHGQGNLAPTPSPLSHGGINPINSPGPVEYISATRTGAGAGHDYAVYSNSVQGFGNGMVSVRF